MLGCAREGLSRWRGRAEFARQTARCVVAPAKALDGSCASRRLAEEREVVPWNLDDLDVGTQRQHLLHVASGHDAIVAASNVLQRLSDGPQMLSRIDSLDRAQAGSQRACSDSLPDLGFGDT